ncbi:MAG: agmatine deiminase family protein [Porphyromonadaceae bacterium]|nr:agmatine deiminase family protein [Porphyromonadaceae bacterium]
MTRNGYTLPAEWYPQSGVQLTWPHAATDWRDYLDETEECFIAIAREIVGREALLIVAPDAEAVRRKLAGRMSLDRVIFRNCPTNDTWARDHGGISLVQPGTGKTELLDFTFNGWGMKFAANLDNRITRRLQETDTFRAKYRQQRFVLEGGSIDSDGQGTLLTTAECLLSANRNEPMSRREITQYLKKTLGMERVLWVEHGFLAGDDTDSHIDTLVRFCPDDTIVYVRCTDRNDLHYAALTEMEAQLRTFTTLQGRPYRLLPLPMAAPTYHDGERLPATYANFLAVNGAILYPTYGTPTLDGAAAEVLQEAFPGYEIKGIDCRPLIRQHGSLHCVTMQYPEGVLNI